MAVNPIAVDLIFNNDFPINYHTQLRDFFVYYLYL